MWYHLTRSHEVCYWASQALLNAGIIRPEAQAYVGHILLTNLVSLKRFMRKQSSYALNIATKAFGGKSGLKETTQANA